MSSGNGNENRKSLSSLLEGEKEQILFVKEGQYFFVGDLTRSPNIRCRGNTIEEAMQMSYRLRHNAVPKWVKRLENIPTEFKIRIWDEGSLQAQVFENEEWVVCLRSGERGTVSVTIDLPNGVVSKVDLDQIVMLLEEIS